MLIGHLAGLQLTELWSLRDDTFLHLDCDPSDPPCPVVLDTRWGELRLDAPGPAVREALRRMRTGPVSLRNVVADFPESGVAEPGRALSPETTELLAVLHRIQHVVVRTLAVGSVPLLSVVPLSPQAEFAPQPLPRHLPTRLSRFTVLRYAQGALRLESPLSHHRAELLRPEASVLLARLCGTPADAAGAAPPKEWGPPALPDAVVDSALSYLIAAGLAVLSETGHGGGPGTPPRFGEDHDPALLAWSPDDLLLHSRSRLGRHDGDVGATFEHAARLPAEPVVKAAHGAPAIPLPRPELAELARTGPAFSAVMERGPSLSVGAGELTRDQIGSLLYQAARVRSVFASGRGAPDGYLHSERPYSSLGDTYALELYLLFPSERKNVWPAPGAYHYDPAAHALEKMDEVPEALAELAVIAQAEAQLADPPELLITITARFRRASVKFSGIAYANVLKDVGALQQALSLVATALGLGSCPLALGDADVAARALRLDWRTESSVGEFLIGAPAPAGAGADPSAA
ncbi:SagB family peptide dehydrogenase [Streptomyces sp. RPT161]|uniref:SagB family peptide dehydrogenase n=1 Tax=Streptomyces sp. RPT161 TaxID=3015993 RepID=UPI0022B93D0B|nr:SagB family peptide dehydrogenase [Streptomyces sp. RPT161]